MPSIGDPVSFPVDADGGEATVTVRQIVDPFGAFGLGAAPAGTRYVYVVVAVANGSDAPLTVDPGTLFVVDTAGFVHRPVDLFGGGDATPGATTFQTVEPGGQVDGGVVFAVPETAVLAAVYHDPAPDRLILLALLGVRPVAADGPAADREDDGGADGADQDGDTTEAVVTGEADCDAFATFYAETTDRLGVLTDITEEFGDLIDIVATDPAGAGATIQGWADELADLAQEQRDAEVPAGLEDLNDQAIQMFETYADAMEQLGAGLASFNVAAIQGAIPVISDADELQRGLVAQLDALAERCGIEVDESSARRLGP